MTNDEQVAYDYTSLIATPDWIISEAETAYPGFAEFWQTLRLEVSRILFFDLCVKQVGLDVPVGVTIPALPPKPSTVHVLYEGIRFLQSVDYGALIETLLAGADHELAARKAIHEERISHYRHETE